MSHIKDQVVEDDQLLLALEKFELEVFFIDRVERLIKVDRFSA